LTIEHWTNTNYTNLLQAARNISYNSELSTELLHYSLEQLLIKPNIQEIIDSGGAQFWVVRTMLNSWRSTTSGFYKIYRGYPNQIALDSYLDKNDIADEEYVQLEETAAKIVKELDQLDWYSKELFRIFLEEGHTISSLSRSTKIPRTSISLTINRVRKHVKSKIN
jgi:hypothetical protein